MEKDPESHIDLSIMISNSMGDDGFLVEMIDLFFEQAAEHVSGMKEACVDGPSKDWVENAHSMKGAAGMVGAESLRLVCARAQNMPEATAEERVLVLNEITSLLTAVESELSAHPIYAQKK